MIKPVYNKTCFLGFQTDMEKECIIDWLPPEFDYLCIRQKSEKNQFAELKFTIEVRVNVTDKDGDQEFLSKLNTSSGCTFNSQSGEPDRFSGGMSARRLWSAFQKCCLNFLTVKK